MAVLDSARPACSEALAMLVRHLPERYPAWYRRDDGCIETMADGRRHDVGDPACPLATAGLLVEEDLLVLEPSTDGYMLTAAFLCAPSHWKLADKIGRSLEAVHGPVPGYHAKIGRSVDRMFAQMKSERPLWRCNWGIATSSELFQPERDEAELARAHELAPHEVGCSLFVRVERQTLRRLPESGAILFTIKVYVDAVGCLQERPELAADLRAAVGRLSDDERRYKALDVLGRPLIAYLDTIVAEAAGKEQPAYTTRE